jgi:hypothetical protein
LHYFGDAFDPEHMRRIANLAAEALDLHSGKDFPDYDEAMEKARTKARDLADSLGLELLKED